MIYTKRPGFQREFINTGLTDIMQAQNVVFNTYGDVVSVGEKAKNLNKFGADYTATSTFGTVAILQGTAINETFVTTNIIDSIVSSSASDTTQTITIEGHIADGSGNLTFVVQDAVLNGQTEVTLTTPLARCSRLTVKGTGTFGSTPANLVGSVYCYDNTDGITAGVPNTDAATKAMLLPGDTQNQKCATSISSTDYWFIATFGAGVGVSGGSASRVEFKLQIRDVENGGAWIPLGREIVIDVDQNGENIQLSPYLIVPKNHDFRVQAKTNANTAQVFAEIDGYLAKIIT